MIDEDRSRFDWDHVLVDESQDWTDAERDLLTAVYGTRRIVLADGLVQLMRRQTSCDWLRAVPKPERVVRHLGDSLRMQHNVALFANAVARTMGFANWSVEPRPDLSGGRIVVLEGELERPEELVATLRGIAALGKAAPVDNLICVPHSEIARGEGDRRRAKLAIACEAAGEIVWDACDPLTRTSVPESAEAWRIVQYDSCRGLEGWVTLLVALDDLYANRLKHPNVGAAEATAIDPAVVACRWLLIPLTRAVHLLVVHVRDPQSVVARSCAPPRVSCRPASSKSTPQAMVRARSVRIVSCHTCDAGVAYDERVNDESSPNNGLRLKTLMKDAGYRSTRLDATRRLLIFTGRTRDWTFSVNIANEWLHVISYVCEVPEPAALRAELFETAMAANHAMSLTNSSKVRASYIGTRISRRTSRRRGLSKPHRPRVRESRRMYPKLFRIVSGDAALAAIAGAPLVERRAMTCGCLGRGSR